MDNLRGLLGTRRTDREPNAGIKELCRERGYKGWMKRLTKMFSDGLAILKEWRMIRLIKECMWESV